MRWPLETYTDHRASLLNSLPSHSTSNVSSRLEVPSYGTEAVLNPIRRQKLEPFSHSLPGDRFVQCAILCTYKVLSGDLSCGVLSSYAQEHIALPEVHCVELVFLYQAQVPVDVCRPYGQQGQNVAGPHLLFRGFLKTCVGEN